MKQQTLLNPSLAQSILFSLHNGVIAIDRQSHILFMNQSMATLLNIEKDRWIGQPIRNLIPNTALPEVLDKKINEIGVKIELYGRQYLVNRSPLYVDREVQGAVGVIQDVSEIEAYRRMSDQAEAIIESSTDGIYVVDANGVTLCVNSAYEEITGFSRDELIGNHMSELVKKGYIDQSVSLFVLEKKKRISLIQKIGGKKDVIVTGNPVFDESGNISMVVTSVRDITQLNNMKRELQKAKSFSSIMHNRYTLTVGDAEEHFVFRSAVMQEILAKVKRVASFPASVLLTGPSGVGKEVVANLIHNLSPRKNKPFIKINCGAIPEHLLESELFGYERGAFTGAREGGKIGLLELADGGTVMLDEIGEMPLFLQVKLLRVLQEKEVLPIGGTKPRALNIRFISATNRDLRQKIADGKFREDLYYRLQVVEIRIPPLVERREDIAELIDHFFSYYNNIYHMQKKLANETKKLLISYHWPGNVRELRNVMESMIVSVPSEEIEPHHLPFHIYEQQDMDRALTLKQRVEQYEKRIVKETLAQSRSIRHAAQMLGINHSTLVKKLQRWQLSR